MFPLFVSLRDPGSSQARQLGHSYSGHRLVSPLWTASLTFALTHSFSCSRSRLSPFVIAPALAIAIFPGSALSSPLFTSAGNPAPPTNSHGLGSVQRDTLYTDTNNDAAAGGTPPTQDTFKDTFYHNEPEEDTNDDDGHGRNGNAITTTK
ncbi:hypothetical protein EDB85DRAFT_2143467 [Lactarius pseudohatsudake]|nr:hypothetical protein EDB85DRAFT_2143467 [Lactarius pseudohatsudake]